MSKMQNRMTNAIVVTTAGTGRRSTNGSSMDNSVASKRIEVVIGDQKRAENNSNNNTYKSSRNFLVENDFTYIDADDDHQHLSSSSLADIGCHRDQDDDDGNKNNLAAVVECGDLRTSKSNSREGGGVDNVLNDVIGASNDSENESCKGTTIKAAANLNKNQQSCGIDDSGCVLPTSSTNTSNSNSGSVITKATINYKCINNNNNNNELSSCDNIKCNENCRSLTTAAAPATQSINIDDRREVAALPQIEIDTQNNGNSAPRSSDDRQQQLDLQQQASRRVTSSSQQQQHHQPQSTKQTTLQIKKFLLQSNDPQSSQKLPQQCSDSDRQRKKVDNKKIIGSVDKDRDKMIVLHESGNNKNKRSQNDGGGGVNSNSDFSGDQVISRQGSLGLDYLDDDEDPYAELELYLEKVKNEINEVFEKLNKGPINNQPNNADDGSKAPRIDEGGSMVINSAAAAAAAARVRSASNKGDNKLLLPEEELNENNGLWRRNSNSNSQGLVVDDDGNNKESAANSKREADKGKGSSSAILPYPKDGCEREMVNEWANSVMRECNELIIEEEDTVSPCLRCKNNDNALLDFNATPHQSSKTEDKLVDAPAQNSDASCCLRNIPKPEKHNIPHKPKLPIGRTKLKMPHSRPKIGPMADEPVLKIEEDDISSDCRLDTVSNTGSSSMKKGSTSTVDVWTSEESILRGALTVDEDNKSTSSSACDAEASPVLSSGKSGNSIDSSELDNDNTESGIGRSPPPRKVFQRNFSVKSGRHLLNESFNEDPDLLDTLSLYDDNNDGNEMDMMLDLEQYDGRSKDAVDSAKMDGSFGTESSSSKISTENDEDSGVVVLRSADQSIYGILTKDRSAFSLPVNKSVPKSLQPSPRDSNNNEQISKTLPWQKKAKKGWRLNLDTSGGIKSEIKRRPFGLPIQDSYQNMNELPSPSTASLHSGGLNNKSDLNLLQELTTKSNSAPLLMKKENKRDGFVEHAPSLRYSRSQSDRYLAEIEAMEACKWLRAAGFPQYAQMYEDLQFPIDLSNVAKDHPFLENDPLQSLYRRLVALNRCATMRIDNSHHTKHSTATNEDSDDDCALSENWTFQPQSRRWSRVGEMGLPIPTITASNGKCQSDDNHVDISSRESSPESLDTFGYSTLPHQIHSKDEMQSKFRRTGSERLKDGAKAFLRRVESIKTRRKKRQNRDGIVISGPQVLDFSQMNQKMTDLKCIDVASYPNSPMPPSPLNYSRNELKIPGQTDGNLLSPKHFQTMGRIYGGSQSNRTSPLHFAFSKSGDDSSSYCSDSNSQDSGTVQTSSSSDRKKPSRARRFFQRGSKVEDAGALSDSECNPRKFRQRRSNDLKVPAVSRGGSLNLGKESNKYRDALKNRSLRSRSLRKNDKFMDSDKEEEVVFRPKNSVVRWHSFQAPDKSSRNSARRNGLPLFSMSCGQLQVVRKLALVTLTGYMERYCPTHRSGWNWELPKFIKKIKAPDYKDKKVFGVPLVLTLQRSGQTIPKPVLAALKWLRLNALDHIGLFRKSGVKSRILKIKNLVESSSDSDNVNLFEGQQAYDVADMVKQYFRDLPESLLTNKLAETFIAIFQHLPEEVRHDAVQSAILLLPDENREVLNTLLIFLAHVAESSMFNQMTANNLAVCLAPSIFHVGIASARSSSVSPRRRKVTGLPDARELSETKASHECLAFMIQHIRTMFVVSNEKLSRCSFSYMEESKPVPLEDLGKGLQVLDWRGYLYECTSATIKEGRERARGWISSPSLDSNVEISYKKVGDGHPLRLWKCCVEVEAPPAEVCQYIIKDRHLWDPYFVKSRVIESLDEKSQVFQYVSGGQVLSDYCVLRSWRTDLPKGACVIVETSIDHNEATTLTGGTVRGVVLASRYLIEPCGSGKSKIMHLARVDTKGRTPEWYNKCYGHISSQYLTKIRGAFKHISNGPESKV